VVDLTSAPATLERGTSPPLFGEPYAHRSGEQFLDGRKTDGALRSMHTATACREEVPVSRIVFQGGRVFDGTGAPLADADLVIEDGRIAEVGSGLDGDDGIDCSGKALLPGLFDTHVHMVSRYEDFDEIRVMHEPFSTPFYRVTENMRRTLACGITTVRDAAGADAGMRLAVDEGSLVGPRMKISVTMLSMTGGHNDPWLPSGDWDVGADISGDAERRV
jgi:hypothetical protein